MIFRSIYNKPILLVGNGVRTANAVDLVHNFAKKCNIPVLTSMNAVDIAQDDLHIGFIGTHGNRIANIILNKCDLVVSIGARLGIRQVGRLTNNFAPNADLVRCDIDEYELSRNIKDNEKKYHSDARDFLNKIISEDLNDYTNWRNACIKARDLLSNCDVQEGNLIMKEISLFLPENPIVAVDVGMNQCWCAQSLLLKGYKGRILISGGFGIMGCSLPYAIGASISNNKGIVYSIVGDGGLQMNIQELETIKREKLPIKIIVINNKVLGKISETQHLNHNDRYANTTKEGGYSVPDFVKIAIAYNIKSANLISYKDISYYSDWFLDNDACLININMKENCLLTPKIKFETGIISPNIEEKVINEVNMILDC